ncbi:hypothetical protein Hdeb2414_s1265g01001291 [Helianthus debilis subsp. tardiflorus]
MDASRGGTHGDAEIVIISDPQQIQNKDFANNNVDGDTQVQFFHGFLRSIPLNKVVTIQISYVFYFNSSKK